MSGSQSVPRPILDQMVAPDQVVVRAAHASMTVRDYLHLISNQSSSESDDASKSVHAYVEYQDIRHHFPELQSTFLHSQHLLGNSTLDQLFLEGKPYLWLGDGDTVGKLHFDQYDNLLVQLEGSKTFRLIDPQQNERLMEGHMREAQLEVQTGDQETWKSDVELMSNPSKYDRVIETKNNNKKVHASNWNIRFRKHELLEATSMVHSPIDFTSADAKTRFPWSSGIAWMDCTVNGNSHVDSRSNVGEANYSVAEALFVPSFFWHEVLSAPGYPHSYKSDIQNGVAEASVRLNVALNYWFAPLYEKEFPCARCRKRLSSKYRPILESLFNRGLLHVI